jgi:cob(I)alamin adenosyltransferase
MPKRITSAYIEGTRKGKPPGFSEVMKGEIIPKDDPACEVHGLTESVRNDLGLVLYTLRENPQYLVNPDFYLTLNWLSKNIWSYSSFCFMKANTDTHSFSFEDLESIEATVNNLKATSEELSSDFLTYDELICLQLDRLRLTVRELEVAYVSWSFDKRVIAHVRQHLLEDPQGALVKELNIINMGEIINRLSSVLFWGNRVFYQDNFESKPPEWSSTPITFKELTCSE